MNKKEFAAMSLNHRVLFRIELGISNQPIGDYLLTGCYDSGVIEGTNYDNSVKTDKYKLILRPPSDLIKPIEHNGEVFTPYIELLRISNFDVDNMTIEELEDYKNAYSAANADIDLMSFSDGMKLIEWHFAIGLDESEYIDVNTLETNPYK